MVENSFLGLVHNIALLMAMVLVFNLVRLNLTAGQLSLIQIPIGVIIGAIGVAVMLTPWVFSPGIIFDTRSVLLTISGLFFGTVPTVIAMIITASLRIYQGGGGALTGCLVILATGSLGIAWRHFARTPLALKSWWELYLLGVISHLIMLALMFTLPQGNALDVLSKITLPVLILYPIGTALFGKLMVNRLLRDKAFVELKTSEERLRESEAKFRSLFEKNQAVMLLVDPSTQSIVDANPAACAYYGWSEDELKGKPVSDINTLKPEELATEMQKVIDEKHNYFLFHHRLADKTIKDVEVYSSSIHHEGKTLLFSIVHDITERKRFEKELQESVNKLNVLFDVLPIGVSVLNKDKQIVKFNPALLRIIDQTAEDLVNRKYNKRQYIHTDGTPFIQEEFPSYHVMNGEEKIENVEIGVVTEKGETLWTSVSAVAADLPDWNIILVTADITQQKQTESLLKEQLMELHRWHDAIIGRENRVMELKKEVNQLLLELGKSPRYTAANSEA